MKHLILLSLLALAACAEPEDEQPAQQEPTEQTQAEEPDTTGGFSMPIDTTWDDDDDVNF